MSEKMKAMGATCGCGEADVERLKKNGLTEATAERAEMHGINLFQIMIWMNTFGPMVLSFMNELFDKIKQVQPLEAKQPTK